MSEIEKFCLSLPLYTPFELADDLKLKGVICGFFSARFDGHCPFCGKSATFVIGAAKSHGTSSGPELIKSHIRKATGFFQVTANCTRNQGHQINYWVQLGEKSGEKVGQTPSLADIANDESAIYRTVLDKVDAAELHRAIGLAAHGVGIGSFVYLRRIFERLVYKRFSEFREVEGWSDEEFKKLRMDEKVQLLSGHLPEFLVENKKLYSILSIGVHELSDEKCLRAFEPIKLSIKIILEEDKKKKEELELKRLAADAIKNFGIDS